MKGSHMPTADDGLSPRNWANLNQQFHQADPPDYFGTRFEMLLLVAAKRPELRKLFEGGIEWQRIRTGSTGSDSISETNQSDVALDEYLAADSELLYHHTIETLLRLYLAHAGLPPVPWLELSRMRTPGEFKQAVRERWLDADTKPDLNESRHLTAQVFLGLESPEDLNGSSTDGQFALIVDSLEANMQQFASDFLDRSNQYNASKHGMAVIPSADAHFRLGDEDNPILEASGPALRYLETTRSPPRWQLTTTWVDVEINLAYQKIATMMMVSLWSQAKRAYVEDKENLSFNLDRRLPDILSPVNPSRVRNLSIHLEYDSETRPDLSPGDPDDEPSDQ